MAFTPGLYRFQAIHEDEAMQIALSESLHMHNARAQEEEEFAMAIRMSSPEQISTRPEDWPTAETRGDIDSDSGTVRVTVGEGGVVRGTLIQALDEGDDVEVSLQTECSDDSEAGTVVAEDGVSAESGDAELWSDFRREIGSHGDDGIVESLDAMSELKGSRLEYIAYRDTSPAVNEPVPVVDIRYKTQLDPHISLPLFETKTKIMDAYVTASIQGTNIPKAANAKTETANLTGAENDQALSTLLEYTMTDDIVIIPTIGTFKRKEHFNPLATRQSIEKALRHLSSKWQMTPQFIPAKGQPSSQYGPFPLGHKSTPTKSATSVTISPTPSTSTAPPPRYDTEEERRSRNYTSLLRAQRRYAEKLRVPTGRDFRFTPTEWDSLSENLSIEEWDAGFLVGPHPSKTAPADGSLGGKHGSFERNGKENLSSTWKGKGKERVAGRYEIEDDATVALRMALGK